MNKKFPALSVISILFIIFGFISILVGLYFTLIQGVIEPNLEGHSFGLQDLKEIYMGGGALLGGLLIVAFGELIKVSLAIEKNTREYVSYKD